MNSYNSISIKYKINKKDNKTNIFGEEFVKNNINNCTMIIVNKKYLKSLKYKIIIKIKLLLN